MYNFIIYYILATLHFYTYRFGLEMTYCSLNMLLWGDVTSYFNNSNSCLCVCRAVYGATVRYAHERTVLTVELCKKSVLKWFIATVIKYSNGVYSCHNSNS